MDYESTALTKHELEGHDLASNRYRFRESFAAVPSV